MSIPATTTPRDIGGTRMTYGDFEFSPVPFIQIDRAIDLGGKEEIGATITINVSGTILGPKHLNEDGENYNIGLWGLNVVEEQRQRMEQVLSVPGQKFTITCGDDDHTNTYFECYPNLVGSVSFQTSPDNWTLTIPYSFRMTAHQTNIFGKDDAPLYLESIDENWSLEFVDEKVYPNIEELAFATLETGSRVMRITRTLSATGKKVYGVQGDVNAILPSEFTPGGKRPHEYARDWIVSRLSGIPPLGQAGRTRDEAWNEILWYTTPAAATMGFSVQDTGSAFVVTNATGSIVHRERYQVDGSFSIGSDVFGLAGEEGVYNHTRQKSANEIAGTYSVTESWIIIVGTEAASNGATDDYTISFRSDTSGLDTVSVEGTITGFQEGTIDGERTAATKISKAENLFKRLVEFNGFHARAEHYIQQLYDINDNSLRVKKCLNIVPASKSIRKQMSDGVISYTFEYNTRLDNIFPDTISESFTHQMTYPNDVFEAVTIPGRQRGPIFFSANTITSPKFQLNYELVLITACAQRDNNWRNELRRRLRMGLVDQRGRIREIAKVYYDFIRGTMGQEIIRIESDNDTWNAAEGRHSGSLTFVLGTCRNAPLRTLTQIFDDMNSM